MASIYTVENSCPAYMAREGGAHLQVSIPCGVNASAIRGSTGEEWTVFTPLGLMSTYIADITTETMVILLKEMIRRTLKSELQEIDLEA